MVQRTRPTMKEVALAAGVSMQTVSRVVNNRPDVSPETTARVRQVIAETGYSPNLLARGLTQGRSHAIGVVANGLSYFGPSQIVTGIEQAAANAGYALSLTLVNDPLEHDPAAILATLTSRLVDGVVWAVPDVGGNRGWIWSPASDLPVPLVIVGPSPSISSVASVGIDNIAIGRIATEQLIAGGGRVFAGISGPLTWEEARQRRAGWFATLREHGIPFDESLFVEGDWGAESGRVGLSRILERRDDVDALLVGNDQMALGALHTANLLGIPVPGQLAVIGVDNTPEGSHYLPPLTTVHQPLVHAGILAVRALDRLIVRRRGGEPDGRPAEAIHLAPTLIVRGSTRPVRDRSTA